MAVSKHQHLLSFRFRLEKYNFLGKKRFCWLNSAFPFILCDFIPLDPDLDPHHWEEWLVFICTFFVERGIGWEVVMSRRVPSRRYFVEGVDQLGGTYFVFVLFRI